MQKNGYFVSNFGYLRIKIIIFFEKYYSDI